MSYKVCCNKHRELNFIIPANLDEAKALDSFTYIRAMNKHLEENPNCKMMRVKE